MKNYSAPLVLYGFYLLAITSIYWQLNAMDMQAVKQVIVTKPIDDDHLAAIIPFSNMPITRIPQFLYENCNQVTVHSWTRSYFTQLRSKVGGITKDKLKASIATREEAAIKAKQQFDSDKEFTKAAEGYDWIYGLDLVEQKYLGKERISVSDIKAINAALSRLISDTPGEFRKSLVCWDRYKMSWTEWAFYAFCQANMDSMLGNPSFPTKINPETMTIAEDDIINIVLYQQNELPEEKQKEINLNEIKDWIDQQQDLQTSSHPDGSKRFLNVDAWIEERMHVFPDPVKIESLLQEMLNRLDSVKHPIARAAYLWYEIIRIHPWRDANKRTGKALASIILLQNGYLPPLMTKQHEADYTRILLNGLDKKDGHRLFIAFITRLIVETQGKFQDVKF